MGGSSHDLDVTYVHPSDAAGSLQLSDALVAELEIDGVGPFLHIVQYEERAGDLLIRQTLELPQGADTDGWSRYLRERMENLSTSLPAAFETEFIDKVLQPRGSYKVTTSGLDTDVVVTQKIAKLTPEMVDWWWDNIGDTVRYHRWHPVAHKTFLWTRKPEDTTDLAYDVGAVQQIVETIGTDTTLNITWLDPAQTPIARTYPHFVYGSTNLDGTPFGGYLVHEYDAAPEGGIVMKSTFRIPSLTDAVAAPAERPFSQSLGRHCVEEMQFLQYFLPALFAAEHR